MATVAHPSETRTNPGRGSQIAVVFVTVMLMAKQYSTTQQLIPGKRRAGQRPENLRLTEAHQRSTHLIFVPGHRRGSQSA